MRNETRTCATALHLEGVGSGACPPGAAVLCCAGWEALLMLILDGARIVVVGVGDTGLSLARWLRRRGARVSATDTRPARRRPSHCGASCLR